MEIPPNSDLPLEIMAEIFVQLPLDSIISCKLVSKTWKNLIENSVFFKLYKVESTTLFLQRSVLYCLFRRDETNSYTVSRIPMILHDSSTFLRGHNLLLGSSDKIACVKSSDTRFFLYNLLTGDLRVVDLAPFRTYSSCWNFHGFGYDPCEDDYKIIFCLDRDFRRRLHSAKRLDLPKDDEKGMILVYSYKNCGWKFVNGFANHLDYEKLYGWKSCSGYYFNCHLHWCVVKGLKRLVAALDVHSYVSSEFKVPPFYYSDKSTNITEFDGCLCIAQLQQNAMDVWVMKEYGVESWTKLLSLSFGRVSSWNWASKMGATSSIKLYKCGDEGREIVVFMEHSNSQSYTLFRYGMDNGQIQLFSARKEGSDLQTWFLQKLVSFGRRIGLDLDINTNLVYMNY